MISKAQGAIEYLLIIAAAILVVAIVIIALTGALSGGQDQTTQSNIASNSAFDSLKEISGNYTLLNNHYFLNTNDLTDSIGVVWHFEESESSVGDFTFNVTSGATPTDDGLFGTSAYYFDGSVDGAIVSNEDFLMDTDEGFSISVWIKGDLYTGGVPSGCDRGIVASRFSNVHQVKGWSLSTCIYEYNGQLNKAVFWLNQTGNDPIQISNLGSNTIVLDGHWHHIVATVKTPGMARIYVDGELEEEVVADGEAFDLTSKIYIGTKQHGNSTSFKGEIDELALWNKELSSEDVLELYQNALEN